MVELTGYIIEIAYLYVHGALCHASLVFMNCVPIAMLKRIAKKVGMDELMKAAVMMLN